MSDRNGRLALVTGGVGGIGSEICRQLAAAGYRVAVLEHPSAQPRLPAWQAAHPGILVELCDVGDYAATAAALSRIQAAQGPVEILVNAAGITRDGRLPKMSFEHWRAVIASNLDGVFNVTQPLFEGMCQRGFGRIVNLSSVNGQRGQFGQANYSAAKAGMHGFTMAAAREGAARNVTVNTVSPGYIATPMTAAIKPEALEKIVASIPMGRMGVPADIARTVLFLVADEAGYVTGANVPVNGGLHMSA